MFTSIKSVVITGISAGVLLCGAAFAQTWAPPAEIAPKAPEAQTAPGSPAAATPAGKPDQAKPDKSADCKAQADAKGLHGKPRKQFLTDCKKS